ncbi:energy transducer TonB [Ottowia sp.]|uniref:energy transducer TonB n=1 Tax=Ottowia sp. TaxID=1898956 RepID=UPI0025DB17F3|nr:energy transducer TonB [Ottowia sp.]MBK6616605.1 TonB C-terminal domain-containing protein [Ottowia sp.]
MRSEVGDVKSTRWPPVVARVLRLCLLLLCGGLATEALLTPAIAQWAADGHSVNYRGKVVAYLRANISSPLLDSVGSQWCDVRLKTTAAGRVQSVDVVESSGSSAWNDAVLQAVEKAGVVPRDIDGRVPAEIVVTVESVDGARRSVRSVHVPRAGGRAAQATLESRYSTQVEALFRSNVIAGAGGKRFPPGEWVEIEVLLDEEDRIRALAMVEESCSGEWRTAAMATLARIGKFPRSELSGSAHRRRVIAATDGTVALAATPPR